MKIAKRLCMTMTIAFVALGAMPIQAAPIKTNSVFSRGTIGTTINTEVKPKTEEKTTVSGIQFKENEFVRITQPTFKEKEAVSTFESQLNIIGEARVDTTIKIKVMYDNGEAKVYDELKPVGVTQTFNQLIDLKVGQNVVVISATHKDGKSTAEITGTITRKSEQTKEDLKNYIVQQNPIITAVPEKTATADKVLNTAKASTPTSAK